MLRPTDTRAQANWIGFVFLLGMLAATFTLYQATVVPQQNAEVEFHHHQTVASDLLELDRSAALVARRGGTLPVTVDVGVSYPPRLLAMNPPLSAGRLHTVEAGTVGLAVDGDPVNVSATCGYGDRAVRSRTLVYDPSYNVRNGSRLGYEHGVVYRERNGAGGVQGDQTLVTGDTISLTPLAGNASRSSTGAASLALYGGPTDSRELTGNVTLTVPTALPVGVWEQLLAEQSAVTGVSAADDGVRVRLANGTYTLVCHAVGLGSAPPSGVAPVVPVETVNETGGGETVEPNLTALDVHDRSEGKQAKFTVDYAVAGVSNPTVEVTFVHPTDASETATLNSSDPDGELRYDGGRGSRWAERPGDPATYLIVVGVYDGAGEPVVTRTLTELTDGEDDHGSG